MLVLARRPARLEQLRHSIAPLGQPARCHRGLAERARRQRDHLGEATSRFRGRHVRKPPRQSVKEFYDDPDMLAQGAVERWWRAYVAGLHTNTASYLHYGSDADLNWETSQRFRGSKL